MIRDAKPSDQSYIAATWTRSMLSMHVWQRHGMARTRPQISQLIDATMDRKDSRALVRCKPHDPDAILGWVMYAEGAGVPVVHYLYTRERDGERVLRGKGIAGELLARLGVRRDAGVVCTSYGPGSESMRGRYKASVHVPLAEFLAPADAGKVKR